MVASVAFSIYRKGGIAFLYSYQKITAQSIYKYGHGIDASMLCLRSYSYPRSCGCVMSKRRIIGGRGNSGQ